MIAFDWDAFFQRLAEAIDDPDLSMREALVYAEQCHVASDAFQKDPDREGEE